MLFKSVILGNLVSFCMKIINSVVVVGLYYGFLTALSIGPAYLLLLRARVLDQKEEGTEKKVAATTGFIVGQLIMFISVYYAPFHLALSRPHTITFLVLPYFFFNFFVNNYEDENSFDYGSTTRNEMRNLRIQCVFFNNLVFQLLNHFIFPSSMLARLVNIYMFRCNNKMLFVTSSFVGWLIGHILFMNWFVLVVVWIEKNARSSAVIKSIRSQKYKYYYKLVLFEWVTHSPGMFSMLLLITSFYYLGRIPVPLLTMKLKERDATKKKKKKDQKVSTEEEEEEEEEGKDLDKIDDDEFEVRTYYQRVSENLDGNKENLDENKENLDGNKENLEFKKKKKEDHYLWFEKPFVMLLFDYNQWYRPTRYIKNGEFENAVRNEMSQFFFFTCRSDGKERISFTYPPNLSTFFEMIQKKIPSFTREKEPSDQISTCWSLINEEKKENLKKEFLNRIDALDKERSVENILEKMTRFCHNETEQEYLPKIYDPFLHGIYRGRIKKLPQTETYIPKYIGESWINKIHGILLNINSQKFDQTIEKFNRNSFKKKFSFFSKPQEEKIDSEEEIKIFQFLFDVVITDSNPQTLRKNFLYLHEIKKKVPRWAYKIHTETECLRAILEAAPAVNAGTRSRRSVALVLLSEENPITNTVTETTAVEPVRGTDFRRDRIIGSNAAQRRKIFFWGFFNPKAHSPLFLDRIKNLFDYLESFFYLMVDLFDILNPLKKKIRNYEVKNAKQATKKTIQEVEQEEEEYQKKEEENLRLKIETRWIELQHGPRMRTFLLVTQSILRLYILPPLLIIIKNSVRTLLGHVSEWSEDLEDWQRETHMLCRYNGIPICRLSWVPLSEIVLPPEWFTEGIQIQILFPFYIQPWRKRKSKSSRKARRKKTKDNFEKRRGFSYLTTEGKEADVPFGIGKKRPSFFKPILKEYRKRRRKLKKEKEEAKLKEKLKLREKLKEKETVFLEAAKDLPKKDSIMSNQRVHELSVQNKSTEGTNYSLREKKAKYLFEIKEKYFIARLKTLELKMDELEKDKKKQTNSSNKPREGSQIIELSKKFWQTFKRKMTRLISIRKFFLFCRLFIKLLSKAFWIVLMKIVENVEQKILSKYNSILLFVELTKKILSLLSLSLYKSIYKNEETGEKRNKKKKTSSFISTIQNLISKKEEISDESKEEISDESKEEISYDLCSFSQAYVLYKLSKIQVGNFSKLKAVLESNIGITSFFVKNQIKGLFQDQGICNSELKDKKFLNSEVNQWKKWLRSHSQYNLPRSVWARLGTKKWKKKINQDSIVINPSLTKEDSSEKNKVDNYKKKSEAYLLLNSKKKLKKDYIYNLFCSKSIHSKEKFFDMSIGIALDNGLVSFFLKKYNIRGMWEIRHRKFVDYRTLKFWFRKNENIESWTDTKRKKKDIKTKVQNSKRIDKVTKIGLDNGSFLDWMGMNEEILYHRPITNFDSFFFPEFLFFSSTYKTKPWVIPIQLLLFNFNENRRFKKNRPSEEAKLDVELESNMETNIAEKYEESSNQKIKTVYESKGFGEFKADLIQSSMMLLECWHPLSDADLIENIKAYIVYQKIKEKYRKMVVFSGIHRGALMPEFILYTKHTPFTELLKYGLFVLDTIRLPVTNAKHIIYRTIGISLAHKNKTVKKKKKNDDFFVPEKILSPKRRREFRILTCLNLKKKNARDINSRFDKNVKNLNTVLHKKKDLDKDKKNQIKLKYFLWPNFRLEDLACINRYWFNTINGNRFSMLRIHMYRRFKSR